MAQDTDTDDVRHQKAPINAAILDLESSQARAVREHLLGDPSALARLRAIDAAITTLRARLPS